MSTYNENLRETVIDTLTALAGQQTTMDSQNTVAKYNLYYAQGTELAAQQKLDSTRRLVASYEGIDSVAITCDNQAINLLASLTQANTNVTASMTNVATAAANIQIASNAVMKLSSDIGAALNIATASMYGTDTYNKIAEANNYINIVANDARNVSKAAMEASSKTAEIISSATLAQGTSVKAQVDNVLAAVDAEVNKYSTTAIAENQTVGKSDRARSAAFGSLLDAKSQADAIDTAYTNANREINQNLLVKVSSQHLIKLSFDTLINPAPTYQKSGNQTSTIPSLGAKYYLALAPTDQVSILSTDQAEQLFASRAPNSSQFVAIPIAESATTASEQLQVNGEIDGAEVSGTVTVTLDTPPSKPNGDKTGALSVVVTVTQLPEEGMAGDQTPPINPPAPITVTVTVTTDVFGSKIVAGKEYAACIYIELGMDYKRYIGDFSDRLSAPSLPFTLATPIPLAKSSPQGALKPSPQKSVASPQALAATIPLTELEATNGVSFWVLPLSQSDTPDPQTQIEYRCILVAEGKAPPKPHTSDDAATLQSSQTKPAQAPLAVPNKSSLNVCKGSLVFFDTSIAEQVAPSNYTVATLKPSNVSSNVQQSAVHTPSAVEYVANFSSITTDNFGDPIQGDYIYRPYVLGVAIGLNAAKYSSSLSDDLAPFIYNTDKTL